MTQMPELVAIMHTLVGFAACRSAMPATSIRRSTVVTESSAPPQNRSTRWRSIIGILIGAVTFSGSVIAFGKLSGKIGGKPLLLPGRHWINLPACWS